MTTHEKIIKTLEICVNHQETGFSEIGCSHNGCLMIENGVCVIDIMPEIIALLKVQWAHIIPKDELTQRMKIPVWLETKSGKVYTGWALTYDVQKGMGITGTRMGITDPSGRVHWLNLEDYGRTWRCWTAEPTEEQREAAEWQ